MILRIQPDVNNVQKWCSDNRLLIVSSRHKLNRVDYSKKISLGDQSLNFTDKYKYLGAALDCEMNLTNLMSDVKKSVSSRLFNFRKLRQYITEKSALAIYKQTILSVLHYAVFLIIACNKSDCHDLQIIQNDALRTSYNVKRHDKLSISKMHKKSNLLSLELFNF